MKQSHIILLLVAFGIIGAGALMIHRHIDLISQDSSAQVEGLVRLTTTKIDRPTPLEELATLQEDFTADFQEAIATYQHHLTDLPKSTIPLSAALDTYQQELLVATNKIVTQYQNQLTDIQQYMNRIASDYSNRHPAEAGDVTALMASVTTMISTLKEDLIHFKREAVQSAFQATIPLREAILEAGPITATVHDLKDVNYFARSVDNTGQAIIGSLRGMYEQFKKDFSSELANRRAMRQSYGSQMVNSIFGPSY